MTKGVLISIVIPSFNDDRILECLDSIIGLDIPRNKFQIIVQDGGSDKELLTLIKSKLSKNDVLTVENDKGIFDAINKGISLADGHYIATLGSDDRCLDLTHDDLTQYKSRDVDVIMADIQYTDQNWQPVRFWRGRQISIWHYLIGRQYAHFGLICTKSVYEKVGLFNIQNKTNADYEFFYFLCLAIRHFKQETLSRVVTQMRVGGNSSRNISTILRANLIIVKFIIKTNPLLLIGLIFKPLHKLNEYWHRNEA